MRLPEKPAEPQPHGWRLDPARARSARCQPPRVSVRFDRRLVHQAVKPALILALALFARAETLDAIFARMDKDAKQFKSATANLHQTEYTAAIKEASDENGELHIKRAKGGTKLRADFGKPNERVVTIDGNRLTIFYPKANSAEKYDIAKYTSSNTVEQLLLLSFGAASGAELKKDYTVTAAGTETIDSKVATRVELVPKSEQMRKVVQKISLWIPEGRSDAVREKVNEAGSNYIEFTFSNTKLNGPVSDGEVTLKLPSNVHLVGAK
jgi:outer membrane lipoprotein-sorting protein